MGDLTPICVDEITDGLITWHGFEYSSIFCLSLYLCPLSRPYGYPRSHRERSLIALALIFSLSHFSDASFLCFAT